jgi:hypothetical protein
MMYFADEILQLSDSDRVRKQEKIDERIIEIVEQEQEIKVYADDSRLIFIGKIQ